MPRRARTDTDDQPVFLNKVVMPRDLADRLEARVLELQRQDPTRLWTKSALVRQLIDEGLARMYEDVDAR